MSRYLIERAFFVLLQDDAISQTICGNHSRMAIARSLDGICLDIPRTEGTVSLGDQQRLMAIRALHRADELVFISYTPVSIFSAG